MSDDFRLASARDFLGPKMPFIETIIQQHMSAQLGLGATSIATMAKKEAVAQQDPFLFTLLLALVFPHAGSRNLAQQDFLAGGVQCFCR